MNKETWLKVFYSYFRRLRRRRRRCFSFVARLLVQVLSSFCVTIVVVVCT